MKGWEPSKLDTNSGKNSNVIGLGENEGCESKIGLMNQLLKMMQKYMTNTVEWSVLLESVWDNENSPVEDQRITMKSVYHNMGAKSLINFISRNLNLINNSNIQEESLDDKDDQKLSPIILSIGNERRNHFNVIKSASLKFCKFCK